MKTSILICNIVNNEGELEYSKLIKYIEDLTKMGFLEVTETSAIKLTKKGEEYIKNNK